MEQQAQEQLRQIHGAQLTPRVVAAIRRQLPQQTPTAAQIARTLELSERSLRRRLQSEQISFGDLLARVRRELALHYLAQPRPEEHTSELQSLMRISYAVFCLKKKKNKQLNQTPDDTELLKTNKP